MPNIYKIGECIEGIKIVGEGRSHNHLLFECPFCEKQWDAMINDVKRKHTTSCGCRFKGKQKHGHTAKGGYVSPEYKCWYGMIRRCTNPRYDKFEDYGAKGIKVCDRWLDFNLFFEDMGNRPTLRHTLDRHPNNKGNYEPGNVRWATSKQQSNNLTTNLRVIYHGVDKTLVEWCELFELSYNRMRERIFRMGIPPEEAFILPKRSRRIIRRIKSNFISHSFGHIKIA